MKENDIEEARKRLEKRIKDIWFSTTYSQEQEEKDLKILLSDYKRVLKENEELKEDRDKFKKALGKRITYCSELEKDLFENCSNYVIPKQIVKDKIEKLNRKIDKSIDNSKGGLDEEFIEKAGELLAQKRILQELLESEE